MGYNKIDKENKRNKLQPTYGGGTEREFNNVNGLINKMNEMILNCRHAQKFLLKKVKKNYSTRERTRETNIHFKNHTACKRLLIGK